MKKFFFIILLITGSLSSSDFVLMPWMREPWYFDFSALYRFQYFSRVNNGYGNDNNRNISHWVESALVVPLFSNFDLEAKIEINEATDITFGLESIGIQGRKLWFDGITGDIFTLTTPINIRIVPKARLQSVATPYHNVFNVEAGCAVGKEFARGGTWISRFSAGSLIGSANTGSPWLKSFINGEIKRGPFVFGTILKSYIGFGSEIKVDVDNFKGYANIDHSSIDIEFFSRKKIGLWGNLLFIYTLRPYARSYPEQLSSGSIVYDIGFSF